MLLFLHLAQLTHLIERNLEQHKQCATEKEIKQRTHLFVMSSGVETSLIISGNSKRFLDFTRNDKWVLFKTALSFRRKPQSPGSGTRKLPRNVRRSDYRPGRRSTCAG